MSNTIDYGNGLLVEFTEAELARLASVKAARAGKRLVGQVFGDWTVLWRADARGKGIHDGLSPYVTVKCKCGRLSIRLLQYIRYRGSCCSVCAAQKKSIRRKLPG